MNRRATAAAAVAAALVLAAPSSVAAVTEVDDSSISVHAPKTVKPDKKFAFGADIAFDYSDVPPYGSLHAGVWQYRGDDPCPKAVPMDKWGEEKAGWKELYRGDWYPEGDADEAYSWLTFLKRKAGTYRWCGYVYTAEGSILAGETYTPLARDGAKTIVRR